MQFHHHIINLVKTRYFSVRLFFSNIGQKTFHHLRRVLQIYFSRLAKELLVLLPISLLIILLGNLLQPQSQFDIVKGNVLNNPNDPEAHAFLAQQFLVTNQFAQAQTEAQLTNNEELLQKIQDINRQPEEVRDETTRLQEIMNQLPNYRDGYLRLAILNWKLYRPFVAQKYLQKALEIDPNNEMARKISETIN